MKNKRIAQNELLYKKIRIVESEYEEKINAVLTTALRNPDLNLSDEDIMMISGTKYSIVMSGNCRAIHTYSDKYDRDNSHPQLYHIKFLLKNVEVVWKQVEEIYDEGNQKIAELFRQMIAPRRIVTIQNFETEEEYQKLQNRVLDDICNSCFDLNWNALNDRAKSLGFKPCIPEKNI